MEFQLGGWKLMPAPGHVPAGTVIDAARASLRDNPAAARNHLLELQAALNVPPTSPAPSNEQLLDWLRQALESRRLVAEPGERHPPYRTPAVLLRAPEQAPVRAAPARVERREEAPVREEAVELGPQARVFAHAAHDGSPVCED
jgi:hypothetical protein